MCTAARPPLLRPQHNRRGASRRRALGVGLWAMGAPRQATQGPIPMDSESKRELWIVTAVALAPIPLLTALAVIAALQ
jgi:hypothetical protein